jgi:subtilisin
MYQKGFTFVALAVLLTAIPASRQGGVVYAALPDRYLVVLRDDVAEVPAIANEHARRYGGTVGHLYRHALKGYSIVIPPERGAEVLAEIKGDPRVAFVSEDRPVWAMAQTLPTGVNRIEADQSSTLAGDGAGSVNVAVAVIDTGIETNHPDLNVVGGKNCSTGGSYKDGNGHGTHVAGTIGAKDNGTGVVGVAPGAPLYAVRVLNNAGSGTTAAVVCGIDWVAANAAVKGIKVANMSLGGGGADDGNCGNSNNDAMHKAVCGAVAKGVTVVVAAGNSAADLSSFVPAAYNEVLTVAAMADFDGQPGGGAPATCRTDVDETAADFSNFTTVGSDDVNHTIAAPGVCINSTWKGSGYNTISGTSMATPHVTGAVALCIASGGCLSPSGTILSPSAIIDKLRSDAHSQPPPGYGYTGDPDLPNGNRYYGYLIYAGGY